MRIDIVTIFPDFFREPIEYGIVGRARTAGLVEIRAHDLRGWTTDRHKIVDDRPFGGGDGMVLKPEPIFDAVQTLTGSSDRTKYPPGSAFDSRCVRIFVSAGSMKATKSS